MRLKIETPPAFIGTPEQQLRTVYSYLVRMAENLNVALGNMSGDGFRIRQQRLIRFVENGDGVRTAHLLQQGEVVLR